MIAKLLLHDNYTLFLIRCARKVAIVLCPAPSLSLCALVPKGDTGEEVLYGTQNGRVGLVQVGLEEPLYRWDMDNEKREGGEGRWRK